MKNTHLRRMVFILGFMAFWVQGDNYAASPLIVEIARDLNLDISTTALSVTAYMIPFGLFTLLFGPLADRFGKARIVNTAAFVTAIFSALGAAAFDIKSLSMIRAVNGAFAAGILPVTMALIGDSFRGDRKSIQNALGQVIGMMFLGGAVAPAIGGALAYLGSWRLVYLVYGVAELITAIIMLLVLEKQPGTADSLNFGATYREALSNSRLLQTVSILFLVGGSAFGSFTYAGKFVQITTGYNILVVGLILAIFGLAAVLGGRKSGTWRHKLGNRILVYAGLLGFVSWVVMGVLPSPVSIILSLAAYGLAFIMIQPTVVTAAQRLMPQKRGTVMSLASFNMFVGGGIGTFLNGHILNRWGYETVFVGAGILILIAGTVAAKILHSIDKQATASS